MTSQDAMLGDVPHDEMRDALHEMADWVADYREGLRDRAIMPAVRPGDIAAGFPAHMPEHGTSLATLMASLDAHVMPGVLHWGHPAFLGYFGSTSNGPALIGEIAAAALNVSAMTWKTSPAATEMETMVLAWIAELLALPASHFGIVYDTASVAILHALAAARERALDDVRGRGLLGRHGAAVLRVYASDQAHSSVDKAMVMLGLGDGNVVRVASDGEFRMDVQALRAAMSADLARGYTPMAVVATVGTTSTASVDPVRQIADACAEFGAWLHCDAAYGGAMAALPEARDIMDGVEAADSIVVNPHKWLFVPLDFSTLYVKDPEGLRRVFANVPEYLEGDSSAGTGVVDYMDYGIQLGRRFRALKAWMVLAAFGREGIVSRIREHRRLAALLGALVRDAAEFELCAPIAMGVVCFRMVPANCTPVEVDAVNEGIVREVNASGAAYITHTRLRGRTCVRVGFGNVQTTEDDVRSVWGAIEVAARLS